VCKKLHLLENYSNRQLKRAGNRICCDCIESKKVANLVKSPSTGRRQGDEHLNEITLDGDYYAKFIPESSKRELKKKVAAQQHDFNVIDNDPASARNPLGINQYTDIETPFLLYSEVVQKRKLAEIKSNLKTSCDEVLDRIEDVDLQSAAKSKYLSALYTKEKKDKIATTFDLDNNQRIQQGLHDCYHSIPINSPIRASFIQSIFPVATDAQFIADILEIDVSSVHKSLKSNVEHLDYYLRDLGFIRDRLGEKRTDLEDWLIKRCGPPSGRHKRYYTYGIS
jgi:hypothetical protein